MKNWKLWASGLIVLAGIVVLAIFLPRRAPASPESVSLTRIAQEIREGQVTELEVSSESILVTLADKSQLSANKETDATLEQTLGLMSLTPGDLAATDLKIRHQSSSGNLSVLGSGIIAVVMAGVIFLALRGAGGKHAMGPFGKSGARLREAALESVTFSDVAGAEEAKEELAEVVEFLRNPMKFRAVGAHIPKGVLLVGPPGTGKTLLAKAVAGEAAVPFYSISGSEFVEMFVGVGASRVRDLFRSAKRHSPCIVFVDEIDAVGRQRGQMNSHDEREQTLNQLLVEMDGFDTDQNVVVIAATNRVDILDAALLRPGRFDRRINVDRPDVRGREAILKVHTRGKPVSKDVELNGLARSIPGFVGADIANLVNEAAILCARRDKAEIGTLEFREAVERIIAGPEKKHRLVTAEERRVVAYHEAGHAVVMHYLPDCDPVHKVSIVARGQMGGYTMVLPENESTLYARRKFMAELAGLLGGRAAEEIVVGEVTTGASNDMERATRLARDMATRYGMSEKLGPVVYGQRDEGYFGYMGGRRDYSESVAIEIDDDVRQTVAEAYQVAKEVLTRHREALEKIAQTLLDKESLDGEELRLMCAATLPKKSSAGFKRSARRSWFPSNAGSAASALALVTGAGLVAASILSRSRSRPSRT